MNTPVKHHFVPQLLLRRFDRGDGRVYLLRKNDRQKQPRAHLPDEVFFENNSNTYVEPCGTKNYSVETALAQLESDFGPIVQQICTSVELGRAPEIEQKSLRVVREFLLTLFKRSPVVRNRYATGEFINSHVDGTIREIVESGHVLPNSLVDKVTSAQWKKDALKHASVRATLLHADGVAMGALASKGLWIARPSNSSKSFILGSVPFLQMKGTHTDGIGDPSSEFWLPLSPTVAITPFGHPNDVRLVELPDNAVRQLNLGIWHQSYAAVARSPELLVSIAKAR